jgi:hypothetical protein
MDHGPGAAPDANIPCPEHLERRNRGIGQVLQVLGFSVAGDVLFTCELRHGARDGIVEASVQRAKVIRADGRRQFDGQIGDRLTTSP